MKVRISRQAWNDLIDVEHFGFRQLETYEFLIEAALDRIAKDPMSGNERP